MAEALIPWSNSDRFTCSMVLWDSVIQYGVGSNITSTTITALNATENLSADGSSYAKCLNYGEYDVHLELSDLGTVNQIEIRVMANYPESSSATSCYMSDHESIWLNRHYENGTPNSTSRKTTMACLLMSVTNCTQDWINEVFDFHLSWTSTGKSSMKTSSTKSSYVIWLRVYGYPN
jgi:hypothetical protein